jgi:hypothetical protein
MNLVFLFWLFSFPAQAYIPPSYFILNSLVIKHTGPTVIKFQVKVSQEPGAFLGPGVPPLSFKENVTVNLQKRLLKSQAFNLEGKELYSLERNLADTQNVPPLAELLLFELNSFSLSKMLLKDSIPIRSEGETLPELSWLGRWKGKVAWVIGPKTKEGEKPAPQLWVEKDQFLPLKLVIQKDDSVVTIGFESYRFYKEWPFPQSLSVIQSLNHQEIPLLTAEISHLTLSLDPKDEPIFTHSDFHGFTDVGSLSPLPLQALIQNYYLWLR